MIDEMLDTGKILYASSKKIRLVNAKVNTLGPAGIICSLRKPEDTGTAKAKYSTMGLILDEIMLDKTVSAYEKSDDVYVSFSHDGVSYGALYDGAEVFWVDKVPDDYHCLIPYLAYALSTANEAQESHMELRSCFEQIKENKNVAEAVLELCDAFYFGFIKYENHKMVCHKEKAMQKRIIEEAIATNVYNPIDLFIGLSSVMDVDTTLNNELLPEGDAEESGYAINYHFWDEASKSKIPPTKFLDTYVQTDVTVKIARKIKYRLSRVMKRMDEGCVSLDAIRNDYVNIIMVGRPGTGKTSLANAVGAMTRLPVYSVLQSKNTEEDNFEGKNKVVKGRITFVETEFLKAYEHGGIILLEEINLADPGVTMGAVGQAMEYPFILMKDGYEPIRRHPLCVIIGTMNTGTAGSRKLNQALSSRFKSPYKLKDPKKDTFIKILLSQGHNRRRCKYVYDAYIKIIKHLQSPQINQSSLCDNITLRACIGALENWEEGAGGKEAIEDAVVGKIAEYDLDVADEVMRTVVDPLPDCNF